MTTKPATPSSKPAPPPAAAVAADAHWAAKMQRLRDRNLAETTFTICDDPDIRSRYLRAQRAFDLSQSYAKDHADDPDALVELSKAAVERDAAKTDYDDISIPIRFRSLPRPALEALYKAHKPSETEAEDGSEWAATFPAALISAASVDGMTETEAQELLDAWSLAEANAMFQAAHSLQSSTRTDLGKG